MLSFSANLNFLFNEVDFMERFKYAAAAGFKYVEFMFPYDHDIKMVKAKLDANDLQLVLFNLPAGDWSSGDRGIAVEPARVNEFKDGVARAIEASRILHSEKINCLMGIPSANTTPDEARITLKENMTYTAEAFQKAGLSLMIEPINRYDIPGFLMNTTEEVLGLIDEIGASNLYLQFDLYHAGREDEDLSKVIADRVDQIGHVQIADRPNRNEPGTGDLPLKQLLSQLDDVGYSGFVGLEYKPSLQTERTLGWLDDFGYNL